MVMSNFKEYLKLYVPVLLAIGLVVSAYLHLLQIDNPDDYRESILIFVEFGFILSSLVGVSVVAIVVVVYLIRRKWIKLLHGVLSMVITLLLVNAGFVLDATTLVYMT